MNSSKGFLHLVYQNYVKRACENLGVSNDTNEETENSQLSDSDYPPEFVVPSKEDREAFLNGTQLD